MGYRIGVDIGGTFTDFCAFDESSGAVHTLKVLSTPDVPGAEVVDDVHVARPPETFIFEMVRFEIGDGMAHIVFAAREGLFPDGCTPPHDL